MSSIHRERSQSIAYTGKVTQASGGSARMAHSAGRNLVEARCRAAVELDLERGQQHDRLPPHLNVA